MLLLKLAIFFNCHATPRRFQFVKLFEDFLLSEGKLRKYYSNRVHRTIGYFYVFSTFHDPYSNKKVISRFHLSVCLSGVYPFFLDTKSLKLLDRLLSNFVL